MDYSDTEVLKYGQKMKGMFFHSVCLILVVFVFCGCQLGGPCGYDSMYQCVSPKLGVMAGGWACIGQFFVSMILTTIFPILSDSRGYNFAVGIFWITAILSVINTAMLQDILVKFQFF